MADGENQLCSCVLPPRGERKTKTKLRKGREGSDQTQVLTIIDFQMTFQHNLSNYENKTIYETTKMKKKSKNICQEIN